MRQRDLLGFLQRPERPFRAVEALLPFRPGLGGRHPHPLRPSPPLARGPAGATVSRKQKGAGSLPLYSKPQDPEGQLPGGRPANSPRVGNCGQTTKLPQDPRPDPPSRLGTRGEGEGNLARTTAPTASGQGPAPAHHTRGLKYPTLTGKRGRVLAPARPPESGGSPRASGEAAAGTPSPPPALRCAALRGG